MGTIEELISGWDGEYVVSRHDRDSNTWIFIAIHSTALGAPSGGTRLRVYPQPGAGLRDAMRLAAGMTAKWATLGLPIGGGKAVLAAAELPTGDARRALLLSYGDLVESLQGAFGTGEDLGTTPEDMATIAERTSHVHGALEDGRVTDPGPFTARGVFRSIEAGVRVVLGRDDLVGTSVLVQGVGDVGEPLCRLLADAGAQLIVADSDGDRVERLRTAIEAEVVDAEAAYDTDCEVFAPCAVGGVLDESTIARLRCRLVAGSANNQLASAEDALRLHHRGIVYGPDYVVNGGGALAFALHTQGQRDLETLMNRMDQVGVTVGEILHQALRLGESPHVIAQRRVDEKLARARGGAAPEPS